MTGDRIIIKNMKSDPIEAHVSDMLAEATRLHQAAMGELHSPHDNPLPRLKKALKLLEDVEVLADDSASYVDSEAMKEAIKQLHLQQGQIQAMIVQLEAQANRFNLLPWILLGLLTLTIVVFVV